MAEIVQTLFGVSPESYQQQQSALADQQALQYAKLTPFQQANYGIGRGAYQLAGALGGEDPELRKISQRQQIASQINPNDPASIERGIVALSQGGDPEGAFMLQAEYRKMQESGALIGQREAAGKASLAQAGRERQQSIPNDIQLAREIANLQEKVSQLTGLPASPERDEALRLASGQLAQLERLTAKADSKKPTTNELTNAENIALLAGPVGSPAYNAKFMAEYNRLTAPKEAKVPRFGDAAERYAKSMFKGKAYDELTDAEAEIVNKRVDAEAASKATKVSVNLSDPTATAKASLDVMNKWEGFLKSGGDVEVANRYKTVQSAVAMANAGNPTADGSLLYNIAKMYDPGGAVQEGDKKSITGNPAIPDKFKLLVQGVLEGGSFTPQQRKNLEAIANDIVKNRQGQLQRYQKQYIKKNTSLGGDAQDIFDPYEGLLITQPPSGASLIPSDSTGTKSNVGPAIPAAPMPPTKQVRKPSGTPGAVNWKDL